MMCEYSNNVVSFDFALRSVSVIGLFHVIIDFLLVVVMINITIIIISIMHQHQSSFRTSYSTLLSLLLLQLNF